MSGCSSGVPVQAHLINMTATVLQVQQVMVLVLSTKHILQMAHSCANTQRRGEP